MVCSVNNLCYVIAFMRLNCPMAVIRKAAMYVLYGFAVCR